MADTSLPQSILRLFSRTNELKLLPRTGWLLAGIPQAESLADHTCNVALYALFLGETINRDPGKQGLEAPLDIARTLSLALIHDLAESVLTDLPKRSTDVLGAKAKHRAERTILVDMLDDLPGGARYVQLWDEYVRAASPEARLVKDVDRLEMAFQGRRYAARGHRGLAEFWEDHDLHYPICRDLLRQIALE